MSLVKRTVHLARKKIPAQPHHKRLSRSVFKRKRPPSVLKTAVNVKTKKRVGTFRFFLSLFVISVTLLVVAAIISLRILPGLVLPEDDTTVLLYSSRIAGDAPPLWLITMRGSHRSTEVIQLTLIDTDLLNSGLRPDMPASAILPSISTQSSQLVALSVGQSLGLIIDWALPSSNDLLSEEMLKAEIATQAWGAVAKGNWTSPWLQLAIAMFDVNEAHVADPRSLPRILDRIDLALMGDFSACPIAVLNDTTQNGLAARFATLIEQSGGQVVRTDGIATYESLQSPSKETHQENKLTRIYLHPSADNFCEIALRRLSNQLANPQVIIDVNVTQRLRSSLVVVLGSEVLNGGIFTASDQYPQ